MLRYNRYEEDMMCDAWSAEDKVVLERAEIDAAAGSGPESDGPASSWSMNVFDRAAEEWDSGGE